MLAILAAIFRRVDLIALFTTNASCLPRLLMGHMAGAVALAVLRADRPPWRPGPLVAADAAPASELGVARSRRELAGVFLDRRLAGALVERITGKAHIIDTGTESWRLLRHWLRSRRRAPGTRAPGEDTTGPPRSERHHLGRPITGRAEVPVQRPLRRRCKRPHRGGSQSTPFVDMGASRQARARATTPATRSSDLTAVPQNARPEAICVAIGIAQQAGDQSAMMGASLGDEDD